MDYWSDSPSTQAYLQFHNPHTSIWIRSIANRYKPLDKGTRKGLLLMLEWEEGDDACSMKPLESIQVWIFLSKDAVILGFASLSPALCCMNSLSVHPPNTGGVTWCIEYSKSRREYWYWAIGRWALDKGDFRGWLWRIGVYLIKKKPLNKFSEVGSINGCSEVTKLPWISWDWGKWV